MTQTRESASPEQATETLPAIELAGICKEFSSHGDVVQAVAGVDLEIGAGEFFSLLGPSGCGKTTTMRMIAGFEEPTSGEVKLYGKSVLGVPPNKRDVNMVFQSYALFPHMSVFDNVAFGLRRKGVAKDEVTRGSARSSRPSASPAGRSAVPRELSGGQQQRVALARALVNRPRALLLDEPLGALDLKLRQAMQVELKRIQREVGITFIYVTHDQGEALTMSDRIAVMNEGRVEQLGSPRAIYERPATRFVAGFIGTSNMLSGDIESLSGDRAVILSGDGQHIEVPLREGLPSSVGSPVELTVRPEKIDLRLDAAGSGDLPAARHRHRGRLPRHLHELQRAHLDRRRGDGLRAELQQRRRRGRLAGSDVWLSWEPQHSYVIGAK